MMLDLSTSNPNLADQLFEEFVEEKLSSETNCMICFGVLKKTKTVRSCMHRFCVECIERAMRINNKECPLCKAHIPSRRSLGLDTKFDDYIEIMYGDPVKLNEKEGKMSDEWWTKNKGSFKHIGDAYKKQRQATKGKRAPTVKPTAKQSRPSQNKRKAEKSAVLHPEDVVGYYNSLRHQDKTYSEEFLEESKRLTQLEAKLINKKDILITLLPDPSCAFKDCKLMKSWLICQPTVKISNLVQLLQMRCPDIVPLLATHKCYIGFRDEPSFPGETTLLDILANPKYDGFSKYGVKSGLNLFYRTFV